MNLHLTPISTSPGLQGFLLLIVEAASPYRPSPTPPYSKRREPLTY
jgi:hypothetical protein